MAKLRVVSQDHTNMRTPEELQQIHDQMQIILHRVINDGIKFEECASVARQIIRLNYHDLTLDNLPQSFFNIEHEVVQIKIDPSTTTKKVYMEIIDNIYKASKLKISIKDSPNFTKEQKLVLLIEINYLSRYKQMTQIQIGNHLLQYDIAGIENSFTAEEFSKEVYRFIDLSNAIRSTYNIISPSDYLI